MNLISFYKIKKYTKIHKILNWTINKFKYSNIWYGHGTDNPIDEAIHLIFSTIKIPLNLPFYKFNSYIQLSQENLIKKRVIFRIKKRIPLPYLTKESWFCGHKFYVNNSVFIPRSPISELITNSFSSLINFNPKYILDMCTGSGSIAISCGYIFSKSKIDAVDICKNALKIAKKNIKFHNFLNKIQVIHSDLFSKIKNYKYDIIISNPPYVSLKEIKKLPKEYLYEPQIAFNTNKKNHLNIIESILKYSKDYMSERGILICEVGNSMKDLIKKYPNIPFHWIKFKCLGKGVFMLKRKELIQSNKYLF